MKKCKNFEVEKKWIVTKLPSKTQLIDGIPGLISKILFARGLQKDEIEEFLNPVYEKLVDPLKIEDMDRAVVLIKKAVEEKKKIAIYGDYDVDGLTATALMVKFMESIGANIIYYIPSRQVDGYGLNKKAIDTLKQKKADLIVTVDCGSSALVEVNYAINKGIDVIITDHHDLKKDNKGYILPKCPVLNPKRDISEPAIYNLSGAGVAFYLIRALQKEYYELLPLGQEKWLLDLVALGTICDIVPLKSDNRVLAKYGLKVLSKGRNLGLKTMIEVLGVDPLSIDSYKVGFVIGPRLNAAGRMREASESLNLLLSKDIKEARSIAQKLDGYNQKRQEETERIIKEAKEYIKSHNIEKTEKIFLLKSKDWPAGIIGIAASRLVEEYNRPILIMEESNGYLKGSARSIKSFNIIEALSECKELFSQFGGHSQAAGFKLKLENFKALEKKLSTIANSRITDDDLVPKIYIDCEVEFKDIGQNLINELSKLEPFGCENKKPIFLSREIIISKIDLVGVKKDHMKLVLESESSTSFTGMAFNYGPETNLKIGDKVDIVYTIEANEWKNVKRINLYIIDLKMNKIIVQN